METQGNPRAGGVQMSDSPTAKMVKREIAREIVQVHEDSYGKNAGNVEVSLHTSFIAVMLEIELTRVEETLIANGNAASVKASRETFQLAISDTFSAVVERATGRRVVGYASRAVLDESAPWAIEIFRLGETPEAA
jgi:uncharacterized protein YbcI